MYLKGKKESRPPNEGAAFCNVQGTSSAPLVLRFRWTGSTEPTESASGFPKATFDYFPIFGGRHEITSTNQRLLTVKFFVAIRRLHGFLIGRQYISTFFQRALHISA